MNAFGEKWAWSGDGIYYSQNRFFEDKEIAEADARLSLDPGPGVGFYLTRFVNGDPVEDRFVLFEEE